jgi:hypothetical protein
MKETTEEKFAAQLIHVEDGPNVGRQGGDCHNKSVDEDLIVGWREIVAVFERIRSGFIEGLVDDFANSDAGIWVNVVIVLQSTEQFRKPEPQTIVSIQINLKIILMEDRTTFRVRVFLPKLYAEIDEDHQDSRFPQCRGKGQFRLTYDSGQSRFEATETGSAPLRNHSDHVIVQNQIGKLLKMIQN